MNFADIETTWRSRHNRPSPAQLAEMKMQFATDLRARRRAFAIWMTVVLAALVVFTVRLVWFIVAPAPHQDGFDVSREWGVLVLFALPWAAGIFFLRRFLRHRTQHANYERSIAASVRAALDENRLAQTRTKVIAVLMIALALAMPLIVYQLRAVGKAGDEILLPAFVLFPAFVVVEMLVLRHYLTRKLLPRQRELETVLRDYAT
jgi:hypothetical protein